MSGIFIRKCKKNGMNQWRNWSGASGAIALPTRESLRFLKEYKNEIYYYC